MKLQPFIRHSLSKYIRATVILILGCVGMCGCNEQDSSLSGVENLTESNIPSCAQKLPTHPDSIKAFCLCIDSIQEKMPFQTQKFVSSDSLLKDEWEYDKCKEQHVRRRIRTFSNGVTTEQFDTHGNVTSTQNQYKNSKRISSKDGTINTYTYDSLGRIQNYYWESHLVDPIHDLFEYKYLGNSDKIINEKNYDMRSGDKKLDREYVFEYKEGCDRFIKKEHYADMSDEYKLILTVYYDPIRQIEWEGGEGSYNYTRKFYDNMGHEVVGLYFWDGKFSYAVINHYNERGLKELTISMRDDGDKESYSFKYDQYGNNIWSADTSYYARSDQEYITIRTQQYNNKGLVIHETMGNADSLENVGTYEYEYYE